MANKVRLVGGTDYAGRIEVCSNISDDTMVWGTICDIGWNESDARAVCHQLGHMEPSKE